MNYDKASEILELAVKLAMKVPKKQEDDFANMVAIIFAALVADSQDK
jgi:hypothetical protein